MTKTTTITLMMIIMWWWWWYDDDDDHHDDHDDDHDDAKQIPHIKSYMELAYGGLARSAWWPDAHGFDTTFANI